MRFKELCKWVSWTPQVRIAFLHEGTEPGHHEWGPGRPLAGMMREGPERMQRLQSALTQTPETPAGLEAWAAHH